jgi:predicted nucleotidyltransferase
MSMTQEVLSKILKELRVGLTNLLGEQLEAVYLYGSRARGDARPDSDIDVLVVLDSDFDYFGMIEETGQLAADLSLQKDAVISLAFISSKNFTQQRTPFLINVRREAVPI